MAGSSSKRYPYGDRAAVDLVRAIACSMEGERVGPEDVSDTYSNHLAHPMSVV